MKKTIVILFLLIGKTIVAQDLTPVWGKPIYDSLLPSGFDITSIAQADYYNTAFEFNGGLEVNSNGTSVVASNVSGQYWNFNSLSIVYDAPDQSIYIGQRDSDGLLQWSHTIESTILGVRPVRDVAIQANGDVLVLGEFNAITDFDPSAGDATIVPSGHSGYLIKFDSNGNFVWVRVIDASVTPMHMTLDDSDNIYITGTHGGGDFDPGPGIAFTASAGDDLFVLKLDLDGIYVNHFTMGGVNAEDSYGIAVDENENIYVSGAFNYGIDFGPFTGLNTLNSSSTSNRSSFVAKFDSYGIYEWATEVYSPTGFCDVGDLDVSENGIVFPISSGDAIIVETTSGTNTYSTRSIAAEMDSLGELVWTYIPETTGEIDITVTSYKNGEYFIGGSSKGFVDFNPPSNVDTLNSGTFTNGFVAVLDQSGEFLNYNNIEINSDPNGLILIRDVRPNGEDVYCYAEYFDGDIDVIPNDPSNIEWRGSSNAHTFSWKYDGCRSFNNINASACSEFVTPSGTHLYSSGTYYDTLTNTAGCDSIIAVHLTITGADSVEIITNACTSFTSPSGNYTWNSSGIYTDTLINSHGCDSIITIDLTINTPDFINTTEEACFSYISPSGNYTWNSSGTYYDTLTNSLGCDSIITVDLIIHTLDSTITQSGLDLTANENSGTYQWLDCDSGMTPISGATNQTYTATSNGNYAVLITSAAGCSDTSSCINVNNVSISEYSTNLGIYPNPSNGEFIVQYQTITTGVLSILDASGKLIVRQNITNTNQSNLNLDLPKGVYILSMQTTLSKSTTRLIIQ